MNKKKLILVTVVALAVVIGWTQFDPLSGDKENADPASAGAPLAKVNVPELAGNAAIGKRVFDAKCAACHGLNAAGRDGLAPPLVHRIYEPSHHGDVVFLLAVRNGVRPHHWRFGAMPPVEGLSDAEVGLIVDYIRALQKENGI
ncbi:MAG: c-type cytochrome [Paracoccaceae bacterium]